LKTCQAEICFANLDFTLCVVVNVAADRAPTDPPISVVTNSYLSLSTPCTYT
jgi:hypothetical protein